MSTVNVNDQGGETPHTNDFIPAGATCVFVFPACYHHVQCFMSLNIPDHTMVHAYTSTSLRYYRIKRVVLKPLMQHLCALRMIPTI